MNTHTNPDTARDIAVLNDAARTSFACLVQVTAGIAALPRSDQAQICAAVRAFDDFNQSNDPHGEHDFGVITCASHTIFWKIDYYDPTLSCASDDPTDPAITRRMLTIMLSHDY